MRIGIPLDYNIATLAPVVRKAWIRTLTKLWDNGHTLHPVRLPATQHALSSYYVLAPAEASSNLAKYDGVRFGSRADGIDGTPDSVLFAKTRGQGLGPEVQRRILLGAFSLSAEAIDNYFMQAQKVRRLVQQDFDNVFARQNPLLDETAPSTQLTDKVDVLLCPTAPSLAPSLDEVKDQDPIHSYMNDVFTVPASLAGLPSINVPVSLGPVADSTESIEAGSYFRTTGIQIIGQYGDDRAVLDIAKQVQANSPTPQYRHGPDVTAWGHSFFGAATVKERELHRARAVELGITIEEALALHSAEHAKKLEKTTAVLEEARGDKHIDEGAALRKTSRAIYISLFVDEADPVAAEQELHTTMLDQHEKKIAKLERINNLTAQLVAATGASRINKAVVLSKTKRKEWIARFLDAEDPVAAEREAFAKQVKKVRAKERWLDRRRGQQRPTRKMANQWARKYREEGLREEEAAKRNGTWKQRDGWRDG